MLAGLLGTLNEGEGPKLRIPDHRFMSFHEWVGSFILDNEGVAYFHQSPLPSDDSSWRDWASTLQGQLKASSGFVVQPDYCDSWRDWVDRMRQTG